MDRLNTTPTSFMTSRLETSMKSGLIHRLQRLKVRIPDNSKSPGRADVGRGIIEARERRSEKTMRAGLVALLSVMLLAGQALGGPHAHVERAAAGAMLRHVHLVSAPTSAVLQDCFRDAGKFEDPAEDAWSRDAEQNRAVCLPDLAAGAGAIPFELLPSTPLAISAATSGPCVVPLDHEAASRRGTRPLFLLNRAFRC